MKILVVMGTRPEAIKLAPVIYELRRRNTLRTFVCATGQHRELLDQVLKVFKLKIDFDLNIMRPGQSPEDVARRVDKRLPPLLSRLNPDLVIVQGDTTTGAATALCARRLKIPVAHVEAGLRSFDLDNPCPEEGNRIQIDRVAALHFAPTHQAKINLAREGVRGRGVVVTGNTIVDSIAWARRKLSSRPPASVDRNKVLVTLHRRESFGTPQINLFRALTRLVQSHKDLVFIYPLHPNPRVRVAARRHLRHPRIRLVDPLPYLEFLQLLRGVAFVITDSGGLQEEAVCLGKPVLVMRDKTERPEIISSGAGILVGLNQNRLISWACRLLTDPALRRRMGTVKRLYGDGKASGRIASIIARWKPGPHQIRSK
ncbi:MAG: UDP-N-acetylglucosamine 2-epimerase (non-hydrolyzing) [Elusimicrobiota bacterium]